jgi:uncharacterized alkaline shock family protein YloU
MATNENAQNTPVTPASVHPTAGFGATGQAKGKTVVEDAVVAKVAGIAVRDVPGVYGLGSGVARMVGAVREAVGSADLTQGVSVEVGQTQVAADVMIVAEYPVPLQDLGDRVRAAVAHAITELVGMEIAEINVTISDVHVASDDNKGDGGEGDAGARVR